MKAIKNPVEIGIPIVEREKVVGDWSVNASTMEEFLARQVISNEKIEGFKKVFSVFFMQIINNRVLRLRNLWNFFDIVLKVYYINVFHQACSDINF